MISRRRAAACLLLALAALAALAATAQAARVPERAAAIVAAAGDDAAASAAAAAALRRHPATASASDEDALNRRKKKKKRKAKNPYSSPLGLFIQERASKMLPGPGQHFSFGALQPWEDIISLLDEKPGESGESALAAGARAFRSSARPKSPPRTALSPA